MPAWFEEHVRFQLWAARNVWVILLAGSWQDSARFPAYLMNEISPRPSMTGKAQTRQPPACVSRGGGEVCAKRGQVAAGRGRNGLAHQRQRPTWSSILSP